MQTCEDKKWSNKPPEKVPQVPRDRRRSRDRVGTTTAAVGPMRGRVWGGPVNLILKSRDLRKICVKIWEVCGRTPLGVGYTAQAGGGDGFMAGCVGSGPSTHSLFCYCQEKFSGRLCRKGKSERCASCEPQWGSRQATGTRNRLLYFSQLSVLLNVTSKAGSPLIVII